MPREEKATTRGGNNSQSQVRCPYCQRFFMQRGLLNHQKKCKNDQMQRRNDRMIEARLLMEERREREISNSSQKVVPPWENLDGESNIIGHEPVDQWAHAPASAGFDSGGPDQGTQGGPDQRFMEKGDIRTEYHPHSGRAPIAEHYEAYISRAPAPPLLRQHPWLPFHSRTEFVISKIILEARLSEKQTNTLMDAIHKVIEGEDAFKISDYQEMRRLWDRVALPLTPFEKTTVSAPYKEKTKEYDLFYKPLWSWAMDLVSDQQLAPLFEWDARRVFQYDGTNMTRFYDEPWTGERFWELQDKLPPTGKPFGIILYADKAKLSSFGTQKSYPVIARCANIPSDIRHGMGLGGGRVVGWLPIVEDEASEKGHPGYVNFKRTIWHNSFLVILESISTKSSTGVWLTCGDGVERQLFPFVFVLSADYEEQSVMALIRGIGSNYPCPVCLVPRAQMSNLTGTKYPLRRGEESQELYNEAMAATTKASQNAILKAQGLRLVSNAFWTVQHSDPHRALSWDRMHNYPHGLGGKHIWPLLKKHVEDISRIHLAMVDAGYDALPRWPNLKHFSQVMTVAFSDANHFENLLKLAPFVLQRILTNESSRLGFILLHCLRSYLKLDMYTALRIHTDKTLAEGRAELCHFSSLISEYHRATSGNEDVGSGSDDDTVDACVKSWNFPKMHTQIHLFDDITAKGATRHYSTKPNEQMHGPIRHAYQFQTNFKNVAPQILRIDQWLFAAQVVQDNIDVLDNSACNKRQKNIDEDERGNDVNQEVMDAPDTIVLDRIVFKSPMSDGGYSFRYLENLGRESNRLILCSLRTRVTDFLRQYFQDNQIDAPYPAIKPDETIMEYRAMQIYYESVADWKITWDILRCNPSFYGAPQHDHIMINVGPGLIMFARLLLLFIYQHPGQPEPYRLAYVLPLDAPVGHRQQKDRLLGLQLLQAQPSSFARVIDTKSIIRGAYIVPESQENNGKYYVVDVIDGDMFLRLRKLLPNIYDSQAML